MCPKNLIKWHIYPKRCIVGKKRQKIQKKYVALGERILGKNTNFG
jgi:hypothetical protein